MATVRISGLVGRRHGSWPETRLEEINGDVRRLHFGLGDATDAGSLEVHWQSGERETIKLPEVDRICTVTDGNGINGVLCGAKACGKNVRKGRSSTVGRDAETHSFPTRWLNEPNEPYLSHGEGFQSASAMRLLSIGNDRTAGHLTLRHRCG